ncbi:AI-2E family transporter, partial [Acinetobacter baumannii]
DFIRDLPFVGKEISRTLNELNNDPNSTIQNIAAWVQSHLSYGRVLLGEISKNIVKLGFAVFSLFFFYRDGQMILSQVSKALE